MSGRADAPTTLKGSFSAALHTIFTSWMGDDTDVRTVEFRYGNNAAPTTGDPKIAGEYICTAYKVTAELDGKQAFEAKLSIAAGQSPPAYGTVA